MSSSLKIKPLKTWIRKKKKKKKAESLNEYHVDLDLVIPLCVMHDEHTGDVQEE
jgi:hypothetical protein